MSFLQLSSTNPMFSHLIHKNPATNMMAKGMRQGTAFGWFTKDLQGYNIFFKDADNEVSYKTHQDEEFEYNNTTRYNSPLFVTNALSEFLQSAVAKPHENDTKGFKHSIMINMMETRSNKFLDIFGKYFKDFKIEAKEIAKNNYRLTISTELTLRELLNFTNVFCIFNVITNKTEYIHEDQIQKYLGALSYIDAPYFVRYVFKVNFLRNYTKYQESKALLENSQLAKIETVYGDTQQMRLDAVKKAIVFNQNLVDIGCGEGRYITQFAKHLKDKEYFAIDSDPEALAWAQKRVKNKDITNAHFFSSLDDFFAVSHDKNEKLTFIMAEMIEHMPLETAKELIKKVLSHPHFGSLVLTTPNKNFNTYYNFEDDERRHPDHHFELTKAEFQTLLTEVCAGFNVELIEIGDKVNNDCVTLGAKVYV